jgi:hypothetical protein
MAPSVLLQEEAASRPQPVADAQSPRQSTSYFQGEASDASEDPTSIEQDMAAESLADILSNTSFEDPFVLSNHPLEDPFIENSSPMAPFAMSRTPSPDTNAALDEVGHFPPYRVSGKPNILFIMADQMVAQLLKCYDPESPIKTPNLDLLAQGGAVFENAYCPSPLCAPSRFSLCTGKLPSKIGGFDNAAVLSSDQPTYAHYLRKEGYETVLAGKMHFIGPDQLHGFERR